MNTCNRCGNPNPAGAVNCQVCGTPLAGKVENEMNPRTPSTSQPGLPVWLESLRAGERSITPPSNPERPNFAASDLLDEKQLPTWMRPESQPRQASGYGQSYHPTPATDADMEEDQAPRGISANSLIDDQALPSWMQEGKQSTSSIEGQKNITAGSLIQQDAIPEWLKAMQTQQPAADERKSNPSFAAQPPAQPMQQPPAAPLTPGFHAGDLIDPQSLPSWLSQQGSGQQSPAQPYSNPAGNMPGNPPSAGAGTQAGFSASSLLDMDSLPPWLRQSDQASSERSSGTFTGSQQPQQPSQPSWPAMQQPSQPSWPAMQQPSQPSWPAMQQPSQQSPQMSSHQASSAEGLSASSFIDMDALPPWLRQAGEPSSSSGAMSPQQGPQMGGARPGGYPPVPPRVDNMRVPSRPRNDLSSAENSEMAANVFASMLGVASATPQYPGQPANPAANAQAGQYNPRSDKFPPEMPATPGSDRGPSGMPGMPGSGPGNQGSMPQQGGYSGGYGRNPMEMNSGGGMGNMPPGGAYGGMMGGPASMGGSAGMGGPASMGGGMSQSGMNANQGQRPQEKPAKRNLFDAIRNLFFPRN